MRRVTWLPVAVCLAGLVACGGDDSDDAAPSPSAAPTVAAPRPEPLPTTTPATPVPTTPSSVAPVTGLAVVLDPGHNGGNSGAAGEINRQVPDGRGGTKACNTTGTSTNAGYPEHAFTWDVASRVRDILAGRGITVVMTRPDDTGVGPCVDERAAIGNRANAAAVVSIHADGAAAGGRGFHVIYSDPPLNPVQRDHSLATALARAMRAGGFPVSTYRGSDGLDPRADIAGLNGATVPAAMVECANMRNADEAALVSSPAGRARYADAIANGILTWLTSV